LLHHLGTDFLTVCFASLCTSLHALVFSHYFQLLIY